MRISRFHVDLQLSAHSEVVLPAAASMHLLQVLRLRPGAELTLFDGRGGEYRARLLNAERRGARVAVGEWRDRECESPLAVTLLQGVARGERMDLIVQKSVELGVTRIVPVLTAFSVVRLDGGQAGKRREHWQAVANSACEQCGRNRVPEVATPVGLAAGLAALAAGGVRAVLEPDAAVTLADAARGCTAATLLIGPEGGLSPEELTLAAAHGFTACRLGPRVLRAETAPLAALALLQAMAGDLAR